MMLLNHRQLPTRHPVTMVSPRYTIIVVAVAEVTLEVIEEDTGAAVEAVHEAISAVVVDVVVESTGDPAEASAGPLVANHHKEVSRTFHFSLRVH